MYSFPCHCLICLDKNYIFCILSEDVPTVSFIVNVTVKKLNPNSLFVTYIALKGKIKLNIKTESIKIEMTGPNSLLIKHIFFICWSFLGSVPFFWSLIKIKIWREWDKVNLISICLDTRVKGFKFKKKCNQI